jgi:hypothetical protein
MKGFNVHISSRIKLIFLVLLAVSLPVSCVHRAPGPDEYVPVVDGTITIQCYNGHELLVQGQNVYLIPESRKVKDFFEIHDDDFDVDKALIMSLPGAKSAVIDRYGKFSFLNVAEGNYYVYWQFPPEEKKGVHGNISIDNKVIQVSISQKNNKIVFENLQN